MDSPWKCGNSFWTTWGGPHAPRWNLHTGIANEFYKLNPTAVNKQHLSRCHLNQRQLSQHLTVLCGQISPDSRSVDTQSAVAAETPKKLLNHESLKVKLQLAKAQTAHATAKQELQVMKNTDVLTKTKTRP